MALTVSQMRQQATSRSFAERLPLLREIHATALQELLPQVLADARSKDAEGDIDEEIAEWLEDWLNDLGQLYRIAKKQDFDVPKTLDAIRRTLEWRLQNLCHLPPPRPCSFLRFLPHPLITSRPDDEIISTQPILYLSLQELTKQANDPSMSNEDKLEEVKNIMISTYELGRMYMRDLDAILQAQQSAASSVPEDDPDRMRIVQFVLMVDIQNVGMLPNLGREIATWWTRDLAPSYPGVCNAVYVINYSWAYSAMWAVIKHMLPGKVLSRILFPSTSELLQHFPPECLLKAHGGSLLNFTPDHDEVLARYSSLSPCHTASDRSDSSSSTIKATPTAPDRTLSIETVVPAPREPPPPTHVSSFSPSNPFYGYPAIIYHTFLPDGSLSSIPQLLHGRRRKRDFIRTLVLLYLLKFRRHLEAYVKILARGIRRSRMFMSKGWLVAKLAFRALDLGRLAGRLPVGLAVALTCAALLLGVRRSLRPSQGTFSSREVSWLRQITLLALGVGTASLTSLPDPSMIGVI